MRIRSRLYQQTVGAGKPHYSPRTKIIDAVLPTLEDRATFALREADNNDFTAYDDEDIPYSFNVPSYELPNRHDLIGNVRFPIEKIAVYDGTSGNCSKVSSYFSPTDRQPVTRDGVIIGPDLFSRGDMITMPNGQDVRGS